MTHPKITGRLLREETAALERLAPGDSDLQEYAGAAAIRRFPDPFERAAALRAFAANPAVTALGVEFCGVLGSAASAYPLV